MERKDDHLFISYATEDAALADWLARKLATSGYLVWMDRLKMLGGESWPNDIDEAIKERTFRVLHLVSRNSLNKPNPSKERTLALGIATDREINDFLIPLNCDNTRPLDLPWLISDVNFIPFENWAIGFAQLLKKLEKINAPKSDSINLQPILESFYPGQVLSSEKEFLESNCLKVSDIPEVIHSFSFSRALSTIEREHLSKRWPFFSLGKDHKMAFSFIRYPQHEINDLIISFEASTLWREVDKSHGYPTRHIVKSLIEKQFAAYCSSLGLERHRGMVHFFPKRLLDKDKVSYTGGRGRKIPIKVTGLRKFGEKHFNYHLAFGARVRDDISTGWILQITPTLLFSISEMKGILESDQNNRFRKNMTAMWWNHEWYIRFAAIFEFLSKDGSVIKVPIDESRALTLARGFGGFVAPSIDETKLEQTVTGGVSGNGN